MVQKSPPACPESDKLLSFQEKSQELGEFLDWLRQEKHFTLCEPNQDESEEGDYIPTLHPTEEILAEYFGIDLNKVEKEKMATLRYVQELHAAADSNT